MTPQRRPLWSGSSAATNTRRESITAFVFSVVSRPLVHRYEMVVGASLRNLMVEGNECTKIEADGYRHMRTDASDELKM